MFLSHLTLEHFRNYRALSHDFAAPFTLIQGRNAQGKTNLLEAIYYLATSKSSHARTEKEVVGWSAEGEPIPYSRIRGVVQQQNGEVELEILFSSRGDDTNYAKQVRVNGVNRRSIDLIGNLRAVLFLPADVVLVAGSPGERRRYLDIALCQIDRSYTQHLSRYQKVTTQRNSLLRQLRESNASYRDPGVVAQLRFWDEQLVEHGAFVLARRYSFLARLDPAARLLHSELSAGLEHLQLVYQPSFDPGFLGEPDYRRLANGDVTPHTGRLPDSPLALAALQETFQKKLDSRRSREMAAGVTLYGPHRDDMAFLVNQRDLRTYGSRGQQRTGALALKLAEVQAMTAETGEAPILLLDDVMSELDAQRRATLLAALGGVPQAVVTATDWEDFTPEFRAQAQCLHVDGGRLVASNQMATQSSVSS
ncbi:MAG: DNA replication/repair protein RecF [Caldilineaceae bacterium]|nr:DNA replication/repair protein RecF [Caldilineaceae bacterium]HRJ43055.1 DNA replication/repair protein RecF [Caldilineaceae bacterium]